MVNHQQFENTREVLEQIRRLSHEIMNPEKANFQASKADRSRRSKKDAINQLETYLEFYLKNSDRWKSDRKKLDPIIGNLVQDFREGNSKGLKEKAEEISGQDKYLARAIMGQKIKKEN